MLKLLKKAHQFKARQIDNTRAARTILEKDLTDEELSQFTNLYDDWEDVSTGYYIDELTYLQYKGHLYQCLPDKGHNKQGDWNPKDASSLFKAVNPEGIIPEWEPGKGYDKGAEVTHKGHLWRCLHPGLVSEPGTDRFWEKIDKLIEMEEI